MGGMGLFGAAVFALGCFGTGLFWCYVVLALALIRLTDMSIGLDWIRAMTNFVGLDWIRTVNCFINLGSAPDLD